MSSPATPVSPKGLPSRAVTQPTVQPSVASPGRRFTSKQITIGAGLAVAVLLLITAVMFVRWAPLSFPFGEGAPYAGVVSRVKKLIEARFMEAVNKHGVKSPEDLPKDVVKEVVDDYKSEINTMYAAVKPPPVDIDVSCQDMISEATVSSPEMYVIFLGHGYTVPIKLRARAAIEQHGHGLNVIFCDKDGTVVKVEYIRLIADASPGELVTGDFNCDSDKALANVYRFKIFRKVTK